MNRLISAIGNKIRTYRGEIINNLRSMKIKFLLQDMALADTVVFYLENGIHINHKEHSVNALTVFIDETMVEKG